MNEKEEYLYFHVTNCGKTPYGEWYDEETDDRDRCPECDRPAVKNARAYNCPKCGKVERRFPDERQ